MFKDKNIVKHSSNRLIGLRSWRYFRALRQSDAEVTVRNPGCRFLSAPRPIAPYAAKHWEYAWLADAAYGKTPAGQSSREEDTCEAVDEDPELALAKAGWVPWPQFPDQDLAHQIEASHLRVEVWEKRTPNGCLVAVTFGGTVFKNKMDWRSNLRWFTPWKKDEYSQVVQTFAPAFVDKFTTQLKSADGDYLRTATLVSTGHSLGGGLAQQFAYCLPVNTAVPPVARVYAFDPSPVTGFFSVDASTRKANAEKLEVTRIYERGEILAYARSVMSVLWKPSARAPIIRGIRYNLFHSFNPIAGHSMKRMASKLQAAAWNPTMGSEPDGNGGVESGDLYLRIFSELKNEIAESVKEARATERNTVLVCGGLLTYLLRICADPSVQFLKYLPAAFAIFGGLRVLTLMVSIWPRGRYLTKIEDMALHDQPLLGWETFFRTHTRGGVGFTMIVFWLALIGAMLAVPFLLPGPLCKAAIHVVS
jgi:hypothetical protein